ncbi:MAG: hypothetical protein H6R11_2172, partial [Proteobacteria bacterium]|nr:hypothetical protein [Pseudomonadota bacterium]
MNSGADIIRCVLQARSDANI